MNSSKWNLAFVALFLVSVGCVASRQKLKDVVIKESRHTIVVTATTPIPAEIDDKTQALALAREAAIALGQTQLLTYLYNKETKSDKRLEDAIHPYIEVQNKVKGFIQGARVTKTRYKDDQCHVTLKMNRGPIKEILKEY